MWEDYTYALAEKAAIDCPSLIWVGATKRGRSLAALLAAIIDCPCISEGKNIRVTEGRVTADRMVMGGLANKLVSTDAPTVIITVSAGMYESAVSDPARSGHVEVLAVAAGKVKVTGRHLRESSQVNLNAAKRVVGVGRGFAQKADLALAEELAKALGAELACSRPIAEFLNWMSEERYIGISGQVIKPDLYIAIGISGQPQHVYGVRDAKVIVSINKDENAPMNETSDYSIVGDLREVLPALSKAASKLTCV
jgi:electron transfer flavoprotein alpha subunit